MGEPQPVVLVLDSMHAEALDRLREWAAVVYDPQRVSWPASPTARQATGLIVRAPIDRASLELLPALRAIVRAGSGIDGIPADYTAQHGIAVANTPGANSDAVAEYVIAAALWAVRRLPVYDAAVRRGDWPCREAARTRSRQLGASCFGLLGFGEIGRRVARIAHLGFGARVQATTTSPQRLPAHVAAVDLPTLFASSDIVVLCCALTPATRGLVGLKELRQLANGAVLINVARGAVIERAALAAYAADPQRPATLVLDVHEQTPLPPDDPLVGAADSLLTPHLAGMTRQAEVNMSTAAEAVLRKMLQIDP